VGYTWSLCHDIHPAIVSLGDGMFESIDLNSLQQADRLQTLNDIGRAVSSTLDLQTLYETIYQQIGRVMDTSQFFIGLHRPERGTIELPYLREQGALLVD